MNAPQPLYRRTITIDLCFGQIGQKQRIHWSISSDGLIYLSGHPGLSCRKIHRLRDNFQSSSTWIHLEYYKILITHGGVLVLFAAAFLIVNGEYCIKEYPGLCDQYMDEFSGEINDDTWNEIEELKVALQEGIAIYNETVSAVKEGKISSIEYLKKIEGHEYDKDKLVALEQFCQILREKEEKESILGKKLPVVYEVPYRAVYGEQTTGQRMQHSLLVLIALTFMLAGIMTMEQRSTALRQMICSTRNGRLQFMLRKLRVISGIVVPLWLFQSLKEITTFLQLGDKAAFFLPVQSLTFCQNSLFLFQLEAIW